jgi:hypothetical protein
LELKVGVPRNRTIAEGVRDDLDGQFQVLDYICTEGQVSPQSVKIYKTDQIPVLDKLVEEGVK